MNKRLIAAALCILMFALSFTACREQREPKEKNNLLTVDEEGFTVNKKGDIFVTNINGDLIPVTTGRDGAVELIADLRTKTPEQVQREQQKRTRDAQQEPTRTEPTQTEPAGVIIGTDPIDDRPEKDAVITWPNA